MAAAVSETSKAPLASSHDVQSSEVDLASSSSLSIPKNMTVYSMYYTKSYTNVTLHLGDKSSPCVYYIQGKFRVRTDLTLRDGNSKKAPTVAVSRASLTAPKTMLLASGDPEGDAPDKIQWEEMRREKMLLKCSDYEFSSSVGTEGRQNYSWQRESRVAKNCYNCIDANGKVIARMLSGGFFNWSKGGEIHIAPGLDKKLSELCIVAATIIWVWEAGGSVTQGYGKEHKHAE